MIVAGVDAVEVVGLGGVGVVGAVIRVSVGRVGAVDSSVDWEREVGADGQPLVVIVGAGGRGAVESAGGRGRKVRVDAVSSYGRRSRASRSRFRRSGARG